MNLDVIIVGGGNAALCAALSAREQGSSVLLLERAPVEERGGNSLVGHIRDHYSPTSSLQGNKIVKIPADLARGPEHGRDLPHLGRGHVAEDVAVPVHDAALPGRIGEELRSALGEPEACIRDDQSDAGEAALFEVLRNELQPALSSLAPSQMPRISR